MEILRKKNRYLSKVEKGFSLPELMIVLLIIAIIAVLALPQVISSRRLFRFSGMQRQIAASLVEARQQAMSQRTPITFRYDDANKRILMYGGKFGILGDVRNQIELLSDSGLEPGDIMYGRPGGLTTSALGDTSNLTALSNSAVEITFLADGSVIDASNNPQNNALFFYHRKYPQDTAFAISILGAGGRVKTWRYSKGVNLYVE